MIGVVLAGGRSRRMGAPKPAAPLAGRPMVHWPLASLAGACDRVAVVCKAGSELGELPAGVERWHEPEERRHPVAGIVHALERARAEVLVCGADMPFVGLPEVGALLHAAAASPGAAAVVATASGRIQPVFGVFRPAALAPLRAAAADAPLTRTVEALAPEVVALSAAALRSVDTPEELRAAQRELQSGEDRR